MGEPYATGFPDLDEEIFKLRAELAQVKKERDELKHDIERHLAIISEHLERAEKAEQENARLREALAELVRLDDQYRPDPAPHEWSNAWTAARTALGGE